MTVTPKFKKRQIQKIAPTERTTDIPKKSFNIKGNLYWLSVLALEHCDLAMCLWAWVHHWRNES